jgi:hypothetical protein
MAAAVCASVLAPYGAHAGVASIYDNLGAASNGVMNAEQILFDSFSTGAQTFTLFEVSLLLQAANPADGDDFTVSLVSDNHGAPAGSTIDFVQGFDANLSTTLSDQIFLFNNDVLNPDTRYWIVLGGPGTVQWSQSSDTSGPGVTGEFWGHGLAVNANACCGGPFQMRITGTESSVPEASTWVLTALGFASLGFLGAQRRSAGAAG